MEGSENEARGASLQHYLQTLRRRKWALAQPILIVPAVAVALSLQQPNLYQASAEVLLSRQNLAAALAETSDALVYEEAERVAETQAELARVPDVASRVLQARGLTSQTPTQFLDNSSVSAKRNADLLVFRVTDEDPEQAALLATEYARQFTNYRRELDTSAIQRARGDLQDRLDQLRANGQAEGDLFATLVDKEQQLATLEALQTSNASLVRSATGAIKVQPKPVRNAILGLALGIMLGLALAFVWEALDTRIRSAEEIAAQLGLPLLARLPEPSKRLRRADALAMIEEPHSQQAEAFRVLRTNLDFARLAHEARAIMITSAVEQEGKSTTAANLAVALARAGQRVVLVDLDLRRPYLDRFFGLRDRPGVTHVALGHAKLEDALTEIDLVSSDAVGAAQAGRNGANSGALYVLGAGPVPPDPGEFVATAALAQILRDLRERAEVVLVDAPPMLQVGDPLVLSANVDGLIVVTRLNTVRRNMLTELKRQLATAPADKLGFVLTGAEAETGYGYGGYYYGQYAQPQREREAVS